MSPEYFRAGNLHKKTVSRAKELRPEKWPQDWTRLGKNFPLSLFSSLFFFFFFLLTARGPCSTWLVVGQSLEWPCSLLLFGRCN